MIEQDNYSLVIKYLPEQAIKKYYLDYGEDRCWVWRGHIHKKSGYSRFSTNILGYRIFLLGHRLIYTLLKGCIDIDLDLDHLCRNRACVNPNHSEPVTTQINILRGNSKMAERAKQTHCKRGHEFTIQNTKFDNRNSNGNRSCILCDRETENTRRRIKRKIYG